MIRRGRKAQGGIKKGSRGGEFTITASGKKNYVSHGPKKVPHATAAHKPPFLTTERKKQILAGTIIALGLVAAGASAYGAHGAAKTKERHGRLPKDNFNQFGPHPEWHTKHTKTVGSFTSRRPLRSVDRLAGAREELRAKKAAMGIF
jgi:hypothetical protein